MSRAVVLDVLVLTEDSAEDAHATLTPLLKKALRLVERCDTSRIHFEPQTADARHAAAIANRWKSTKPLDQAAIVDLRRLIAEWILRTGPTPLVVFHFDGDRVWSARDSAENPAKFEARVRRPVLALVAAIRPELTPAVTDARLRALVPYWCIEAWTYQNLAEGRRIADARRDPRLQAALDTWAGDRTLLEELPKPKEHPPGTSSNRALAEHVWPADAVYTIDRSFTAFVHHLADSDELVDALKSTWS